MSAHFAASAASLAAALLITASAFSLETEVIPATDLRKRVPMTAVSIENLFNKPVRTRDFLVSFDGDSTLVRGRDRSGKPWPALLPAAIRGLWKTELNGSRNYYFAGYTGGAGMAPDTWVLVLSFDEQGRPAPFHIISYSSYDSQGIRDLLNLDVTGPQLLQQTWHELPMTDRRSGYYITALYEQRGLYWYRTDGRHGARTFPLFEKWVLPLPVTKPRLVAAPDLLNLVPDYGNDPRSGIRVTPNLGCELESVGLIVKDSHAGRQIATGLFETAPVLPDITRAGSSATITGLHKSPGTNYCTASAAWIRAE